MKRNVEVKARVTDLEALEKRVAALADTGPMVLHHEDVFFRTSSGRLKLRSFGNQRGELIYYERPDLPSPVISHYSVVEARDPLGLKNLLTRALGVRGLLRKERRLYLVGQTRIHLDRVEQLGDFLELEVALRPGQEEREGVRLAEELLSQLGVTEESLIGAAYFDLLPAVEGGAARGAPAVVESHGTIANDAEPEASEDEASDPGDDPES